MTATSPVLKQIAGLPKLSQDELKALWREYFGVEPPAYRRGFLVRGLAHRLQELTYGGLKPAYQARLDAMIAGTEKPNGASRPGQRPRHDVHLLEGTKLLREWRGVTHEVTVIDGGYEHQGKRYRSLSAVARNHRHPMVRAAVLRPAQDRERRMSRHGAKPKVRCAIYCRKCCEEGLELTFNSLDAQREACAAYIDSQRHEGWLALDDRYDDGGNSGGTLERPALQRLIRDIEAGRVDTVVCYKIDRLSRSLTDFAKLVDVFERHSVTFVSVTQSFCTTTSMGRLTLNILLSFAQFERELAGERIRDKFAASRRKGIWMGGHAPLGYDVRDRKLVVNPAEAELVRLIFQRFLDLGSAMLLIRELNAQGHRTKSWTTQAGTFREGRPFDKGTLYKILRNRTYLGEAVHKGKSYQGEHEPIVDRATWDRVHEVLATNAKRRGNEARARTPAPLRGLMRCTHCSWAMTPTHTRRRGRLYRYYICLGASRRGHDTCPVRSIAASEVEALVLGQVRRLLASPELVARTITAVRRENGAAEDTELEEGDVIEALGALEPVWDELYPAEQARILRLLIERIDVAPDGISVTLHAAGIRSLVAELADQERPPWPPPNPCWRPQSNDRACGSRSRYPDHPHPDAAAASGREADHDAGGAAMPTPKPRRDETLIKALVQRARWRRKIESGQAKSITDLAEQEGVTDAYVCRLLSLTCLAPDIVEAILDGRQPKDGDAGERAAGVGGAATPLVEIAR